jgi:hypothetical protein
MSIQVPTAALMIRPRYFGFNEATASTNAFQTSLANVTAEKVWSAARAEFDEFAEKIHNAGVRLFLFDEADAGPGYTPDAVFPNNWVSFHHDGTVVLYPMMAENRRSERRLDIIDSLEEHFIIRRRLDLTRAEVQGRYLEGTGSVVFDHVNRLAYANRSPRTDAGLLDELCVELNYQPFLFDAADTSGKAIYHANVLMALGEDFVIICSACLAPGDRLGLLGVLERDGHRVVDISYEQMHRFAGNAIQLESTKGEKILVMSESAFRSLNRDQLRQLENRNTLLYSSLSTIESIGGGSARCMIAGIHLPTI